MGREIYQAGRADWIRDSIEALMRENPGLFEAEFCSKIPSGEHETPRFATIYPLYEGKRILRMESTDEIPILIAVVDLTNGRIEYNLRLEKTDHEGSGYGTKESGEIENKKRTELYLSVVEKIRALPL